MAQKQKRPSPLDDPPTASSSESEDDQQPSSQQQDEEEVASSEEEEEASSEEEQKDRPSSKNPIPPPTTNSHPKASSSDESATESDSGSDTDSDPGPRAPPKVKPIASKPMDQTPKSRAQAQPSPAPTRSGTKRAVENNAHVNDPKRAKKKANDASASAARGGGSDEEMEEDGKKSVDDSKKLFQRLWSEEDEIAILKGLAEFTSKTGNDPLKYANVFHDFVKKSLHFDASSNQLKAKIRRLKKKFENHAGKGKNGEGPNFSKPHDQKAFELSKKVWPKESVEMEKEKDNGKPVKTPKKEASSSRRVAASAKKSKPETKPETTKPEPELPPVELKESEKMETDEKCDTSLLLREMIRFEKGVGLCGLNEDVVKRGVELIGESKREELEGRWKKLQVAELELFVKRAQLIEEQARSILEAYKSSKH